MAPSRLLVKKLECRGTELRNPQQGNVGHYQSLRRMATFPGRGPTQGGDLDRPPKSPILHDSSEVEPKTSPMVTVPVPIRLHPLTQARKKHGEVRRPVKTTGPRRWKWRQRRHHSS